MRLLAIDVGSDELRIAHGERRLGRVRLTGVARIPLAADGLADALARLRAGRRAQVLTALPASAVVHRVLTLPFRDRRRLARTVPLELAGQLATEIEDACVVFDTLAEDAGGTTVLAFAVRRVEVTAHAATLAAAALSPGRIDLAPLPAWNLVAPALGDAALVLADGTQSAVSVRRAGRPVALRALGATARDADALAAELRWTLAALGPLPPVLVLAGADGGPALGAALAAATGIAVVPIAETAASALRDDALGACAVAAGLILGAGGATAGIRLGGSETSSGSWRTAAVLAAAAVALGTLDVGLWRARLERRDTALRDAIHAAAAAVLPDGPLAAPRAELEAAVASLGQRVGRGEPAGALALLRDTSARVPASIRLELEQLVVEPDALRLAGRAESFDAVETLRSALAASPLLASVAAEEARATVDGRGVEFRLRAERRLGGGTSS